MVRASGSESLRWAFGIKFKGRQQRPGEARFPPPLKSWAPPAHIQALEGALQAAGTPHRIEWYPGTEHGFVFPQRQGIYHQAGAERHWARLFDLFDKFVPNSNGAEVAPAQVLCLLVTNIMVSAKPFAHLPVRGVPG